MFGNIGNLRQAMVSGVKGILKVLCRDTKLLGYMGDFGVGCRGVHAQLTDDPVEGIRQVTIDAGSR